MMDGKWRRRAVIGVVGVIGLVASILIHDQRLAAIVFIGTIGVFATYYIFSYGFLSNWRATVAGRAMFWLCLSFYTLVLWLLVGWIWPGFPGRNQIRELLYLFFALMFLHFDIQLTRIQMATRRGKTIEDLSGYHPIE